MKYKVGDKVKIREDLVVDDEYGDEYGTDVFVEEMERYKGEIATITDVDNHKYSINIDNGDWSWTDEMFEDYTENIEQASKIYRTVDVGFHFDYCGHRVLKNVLQGETGRIRHYYTKDYEIQYIIPIDNIDFIIPHED